jgi:hypothetical protein
VHTVGLLGLAFVLLSGTGAGLPQLQDARAGEVEVERVRDLAQHHALEPECVDALEGLGAMWPGFAREAVSSGGDIGGGSGYALACRSRVGPWVDCGGW